jgi:hypothetical protein
MAFDFCVHVLSTVDFPTVIHPIDAGSPPNPTPTQRHQSNLRNQKDRQEDDARCALNPSVVLPYKRNIQRTQQAH